MRRAVLLVASGLALAGCGVGAGEELAGDGAELRVTRDFGHDLLTTAEREEVRESDTVLRFLESEREVETAYGGGFVQAIDGLAGGGPEGDEDWFYFVNGIEASVGAADFSLSPGDVVQWDHRYWAAAMRIPAIVGAFPEPFLHGFEGERIPTRVECDDDEAAACRQVKERLGDAGVTVTSAPLGAAAGNQILRVVVAPWTVAREVQSVQFIERGPQSSGVFARFDDGGAELVLLDQDGEESEALGPGSGLVAATGQGRQQPVWVVTGVDGEGVEAAAEAFDAEVLRDAFAVAVGPKGPVKVPVVDAGPGQAVAGVGGGTTRTSGAGAAERGEARG